MARIRTIKPDYFTSGKQLRVSVEAAFLFPCLWNHSDDEGRLIDDPVEIAARCPRFFDVMGDKVESLLQELHRGKLIHRYSCGNGKRYIQCHDFLDHQRIDKPKKSMIPPMSKGFVEQSTNGLGTLPQERKGKEGKEERSPRNGDVYPQPNPENPKPITADPRWEKVVEAAKQFSMRREDKGKFTFALLGKLAKKNYRHLDVVIEFFNTVSEHYAKVHESVLWKMWNSKTMSQNYCEKTKINAHDILKKTLEKEREVQDGRKI